MDWARWKINAEVYGLKARAKLRFIVQIVGVGLLLLGAYNMLGAPALSAAAFRPYGVLRVLGSEGAGLFFLADVVVMAVGAITVWIT